MSPDPTNRTSPRFALILALLLTLTAAAACKEEPPPPALTVDRPLLVELNADAGATNKGTAGGGAASNGGTNAPAVDPDGPPVLAEPTEEQLRLLAVAKQALGQDEPAAARVTFEQLAQTQPMSGVKLSGVLVLADIYIGDDQAERAVALLEPAVQEAPRVPELAFVLGRAYKQSGKLEKSILAFQETLRLNPLLLHAHVEIGGLYGQLGQKDPSAEAFLTYERQIYKYSKLLEDPQTHPVDKIKIAEAFSFLPDDRAAEALVRALGEPVRPVRFAIIAALGEVGTRASLPELERARERALAEGDGEQVQRLDTTIAKIKDSPDEPRVDTEGADGVGPTHVDGTNGAAPVNNGTQGAPPTSNGAPPATNNAP